MKTLMLKILSFTCIILITLTSCSRQIDNEAKTTKASISKQAYVDVSASKNASGLVCKVSGDNVINNFVSSHFEYQAEGTPEFLAKTADVILVAEAISSDESFYDNKNSGMLLTPVKVKVVQVCKGEFAGDYIHIVGGQISFRRFFAECPDAQGKKGSDIKFTDEYLDTKIIEDIPEDFVDLKAGGTYLLFLNKFSDAKGDLYVQNHCGFSNYLLDKEQSVFTNSLNGYKILQRDLTKFN